MRHQEPAERIRNFDEVACGFSLDEALLEAERCLLCPDPSCVEGCPVGNDIPGFIRRVGDGDFKGAYEILSRTNLLPAICGRVCPQEQQCEGVCTVGETYEPVAIGRLERFIGDLAIEQGWSSPPPAEHNGFRIAIVGSGPAGLACAADMAKAGCAVTVFEALSIPGGVPKYAIPGFRLPTSVIDAEVEKLRALGVLFHCDTKVGTDVSVEQMVDEMGFHAVFIGTGAAVPTTPGVPGEDLDGVTGANELLSRCNHDPNSQSLSGKNVAIVGAGNTAMDALRACVRLGARKVSCVYRRTRAESPAAAEELDHAEQEGIEFHWLASPVAFVDDGAGRVRGMRCVRMELGEPDASGRRRPVAVEGSEFEFDADVVVLATGTQADPVIGKTSRIDLDKRGYIVTDAHLATSMAGVYAGGDVVTGAATVIAAMGAGRKAARSMKAYLGIREESAQPDASDTAFGIGAGEHNFARIRSV